MGFIKSTRLNLLESDIRFAMAHTNSNKHAARFVGCSYPTYKMYALRYIDEKSQLSLYELHKNQGNKGGRNASLGNHQRKKIYSMLDVLEGKHPEFPAKDLKKRLIREGLLVEECSYCGFNETRITDGSVPLVLVWKDGDFKNHMLDNLELVCYNHYFLMYDDIFEKAEILDKKCKGYYD